MSYRNDFTCNLGEMIPVYWQDLMPNTSWSCRTHGLIRFMPLLAPIMDNIDFYIHFWQAPLRILYGEEFTKMITGEFEVEDWPGIYFIPYDVYERLEGNLGASDTDALSYLTGNGSIFDLLGYDASLFAQPASTGKLNGRKFCMYFRLLSNWYTNENIDPYEGFSDEVARFDDLDFIADSNGDLSVYIADIIYHFFREYGTAGFAPHLWPKDYYTSALPTLQYGLPTYLPLGETAPVSIPVQAGQISHPNALGSWASQSVPAGSFIQTATAGTTSNLNIGNLDTSAQLRSIGGQISGNG